MDERKQKLLKLVVENHIETGAPVGSKFLIETNGLEVSAATVRNEMRDLEDQGLLTHPHTSAGRIPTEHGYRFYVKNLMEPATIENKVKEELVAIASGADYKENAKLVAKAVAGKTNNAVIVAFGGKSVYYTGISFLFSQPEFQNYAHVVDFSTIFDQCEEKMDDLYDLIGSDGAQVLVGSENPLGAVCGLVGGRLNKNDLFLILGPMRMNYGYGQGLLNQVKTIL